MKNLNWILHGLSLLLICFLLYKNFNGGQASAPAAQTQSTAGNEGGVYPIAYFLSDTLLSRLDFFKKSEEDFKKKQDEMQNELKSKEASLQNEFRRLQENAPNLTRKELEQGQQKLAKMEQDLLMRRENLGAQLAQETAEFNDKLHDKISSYLKELNSDGRYKYIFSVQREGNIFYSDAALDITEEMVKGLNEKYGK